MVDLFLLRGGEPLFLSHHRHSILLNLPKRIQFPVVAMVSFHFDGCYYPLLSSNVSVRISRKRISIGRQASIQCISNDASTTNLLADSNVMLLLLHEIGFNEIDAEAILSRNPDIRFSDYKLIRERVRSLQSLGLNGAVLSRLILKRPVILTAQELDPLLSLFLEDDLNLKGKIKPVQIERLLNATEPRFLTGFDKKVRLLLDFGIPKDNLAHVLNNANLSKSLCFKSVEELTRMFDFLNRFNGVDIILRRPATLMYDLDTHLIPRIEFLLELSGGDEVATAVVLRKLPFLLAYSVDHLREHVELLKSHAGFTDQEIFRIVLGYPNIFSSSRERKLQPRIDFLKQCGLSSNDIFKFLIKAPLFISLSFEDNLAHKLVFLVKIGFKIRTKELAMAMGAVTRTSSKNMQEVVRVFLHYGLTFEDVLEMSKRHPQILQYNHVSLEEKMNYLIEEMGREVSELLAFPAYLGYRLDKRIKPRYEVRKKTLGEGMSINKLLSVSTKQFSLTSGTKQAMDLIK